MNKPQHIDTKLEHLEEALREGIADLKTGKVNDGKTVMERLRSRVTDHRIIGTPYKSDR